MGIKVEFGEFFFDLFDRGVIMINVEFVLFVLLIFEFGLLDENVIELVCVVDRGIRES